MQSQESRRKYPFPLTLVITLILYSALAFVLFGERPESLTPELATLVQILPHTIAAVNAVALTSLLLGLRAIKQREITKHRIYMTLAVILIIAFLIMYVTRINLGGVKQFQGPEIIYIYIYLPLLVIHVFLSIVSVPLVVYNTLTGMMLPFSTVAQTRHPKVGKLAVAMWSVSLALGIIVYFLLNYIK